MNEIKAEYALDMKDYRLAVYFAATFRYRIMIRIFLAVTAVAIVCWVGGALGVMPPVMLPAYIFLGYTVWVLLLCARIEHGMFKYAKSPGCILNKNMSVTFSKGNMTVDTPFNGKRFTTPVKNLFMAVELSRLFLIYLDGEQSILLPTRALSASGRAELRSLLLNSLKDRFSTRFGYSSMLPRRSPLRR